MNLGDLLSRLIPLFERKLELGMKLAEAASEREKEKVNIEQQKVTQEYAKMENLAKEKGLDRAWEERKLELTIKGNYKQQELVNSGHYTIEQAKQIGEMQRDVLKQQGKTQEEKFKAWVEFGKQGHGYKIKNADGSETVVPGSTTAADTATRLGRDLGMLPAEPAPQSTFKGNPRDTAKVISDYYKAGDVAGAKAYVSGLDPAHRAEALGFLSVEDKTKAAGAPAPAAAPAPAPAAPVAAAPAPADEGEGYAAPVDPFGLMHRPNLNAAPINAAADPSGIITQRMATRPSITAPAAPVLASQPAPTRPKSISAMPSTFVSPAVTPARPPVAPTETLAQRKKRREDEARLNQSGFGG
jgi:hypothetical protein